MSERERGGPLIEQLRRHVEAILLLADKLERMRRSVDDVPGIGTEQFPGERGLTENLQDRIGELAHETASELGLTCWDLLTIADYAAFRVECKDLAPETVAEILEKGTSRKTAPETIRRVLGAWNNRFPSRSHGNVLAAMERTCPNCWQPRPFTAGMPPVDGGADV